MELREMSEACENQEKDLTLNTDTANSPETSGTEAAETVVTENNSGEDNSAPIVNNTQAPEDNPAGKQVATDYSALDKQGLVAALEAQLQKPIESIRDDVNLIKVAFYSLRNAELAAEKEEFVANGNEETAFAPKSDPDEEKFKELLNEIKEKRAEYNAKQEAGIAPSNTKLTFWELRPRLINHPSPPAPAKAAIVIVPTAATAEILIPDII